VREADGEVIVVSANYHEAIRLAVDKLAGVVYAGDLPERFEPCNLTEAANRLSSRLARR
jgi:hypothetical protein